MLSNNIRSIKNKKNLNETSISKRKKIHETLNRKFKVTRLMPTIDTSNRWQLKIKLASRFIIDSRGRARGMSFEFSNL